MLACLGPKTAGKVLSSMTDDEVEQMTLDLSSLGPVDPDVRTAVMEEFYRMAMGKRFVSQGGVDFARNLLESAFGSAKALEILTRLQSNLQEVPFEFLKRADPSQICSFIQDEHPQTIALILAHLNPQVSSTILSGLPQGIQADIVIRIAAMDRTAPEIVSEVERVLERKMSSVSSQGFTFAGGV
ncbi:MAG: flagellar motor switch protein FliG, partial [Candidatus Hydrogenedentes bacterium]|nr:flagellar motor switch protein FliG [Candidatus Hydrogenedentota bacterium]